MIEKRYVITAGRKGKFVTLHRDSFEAANRIKRRLWTLGYAAAIEWEKS